MGSTAVLQRLLSFITSNRLFLWLHNYEAEIVNLGSWDHFDQFWHCISRADMILRAKKNAHIIYFARYCYNSTIGKCQLLCSFNSRIWIYCAVDSTGIFWAICQGGDFWCIAPHYGRSQLQQVQDCLHRRSSPRSAKQLSFCAFKDWHCLLIASLPEPFEIEGCASPRYLGSVFRPTSCNRIQDPRLALPVVCCCCQLHSLKPILGQRSNIDVEDASFLRELLHLLCTVNLQNSGLRRAMQWQ